MAAAGFLEHALRLSCICCGELGTHWGCQSWEGGAASQAGQPATSRSTTRSCWTCFYCAPGTPPCGMLASKESINHILPAVCSTLFLSRRCTLQA